MVPPARTSRDDYGSAPEDDEDIGEPLDAPQAFHPSDVAFKEAAVPVT